MNGQDEDIILRVTDLAIRYREGALHLGHAALWAGRPPASLFSVKRGENLRIGRRVWFRQEHDRKRRSCARYPCSAAQSNSTARKFTDWPEGRTPLAYRRAGARWMFQSRPRLSLNARMLARDTVA